MTVGTVLGTASGLLIGRSARLDLLGAPLLYVLYPVPKIVFVPVLLVLLGLGDAPAIVLMSVVIFFQTIVTARAAAKAISPDLVISVKSLGASKLDVARHVVIPAALPSIFTALRISTGTAVAVLFVVESIAGSTGIGFYIVNAWGRIAYPTMFAGIIAMALMGVLIYETINLIESRLVKWLPKND
jgi:NitT/TauT family transport system permease protein